MSYYNNCNRLWLIHQKLFNFYGPLNWWPGKNKLEIMLGAILTQNTSWQNVTKTIKNMEEKGLIAVSYTHLDVYKRQVIGSKPIHVLEEAEKKKAPVMKDFFIDVGLEKKEVELIIQPGDAITFDGDFVQLNDKIVTSLALDNRVGVYVLLQAMRRVKNHMVDIFAVATSQEEVGLRGAATSSYYIAPDFGIALDVTVAMDTPGIDVYKRQGIDMVLTDDDLACRGNFATINDNGVITDRRAGRISTYTNEMSVSYTHLPKD